MSQSPSLTPYATHSEVIDIDASIEKQEVRASTSSSEHPVSTSLHQSREILSAMMKPHSKRKSELTKSSAHEDGRPGKERKRLRVAGTISTVVKSNRNAKTHHAVVSASVPAAISASQSAATDSHQERAAPGTVASFFSATRQTAASSRKTFDMLPPLNISGLTRSQHIFSIMTGINARSLSISTSEEFFIFMNLHLDQQWMSFNMTPRKWVIATNDYNARLEMHNRSHGHSTVYKTPRALMEKLGSVEPDVLSRIADGRFTSQEPHLLALQEVDVAGSGRLAAQSLYCSDGVRQKPAKVQRTTGGTTETFVEELPDWPQPAGIFANGTHFNPAAFLSTVSDMYAALVTEKGTGGDRLMEYLAFADMLQKRVLIEPGLVLFKLFSSLHLGPISEELVIERNGVRYLCVSALGGADDAAEGGGSDDADNGDSGNNGAEGGGNDGAGNAAEAGASHGGWLNVE
ncbi:hypothetical protein A0H81_06463 [Grifola frondosa]|uniref:Uncharacterized protein n=1 Tax=Grifola frondosa TaxID=5627 RepID=A0A1C7MBY2_GRIFR|nr:hypothetical protein A0H81_06463 [Grifola frondosa]